MNAASMVERVPVARSTDPATSWAAAASVKNVTVLQKWILSVLQELGPMTDIRLTKELNWRYALIGRWVSESGIRTRRKELVTMGKVCDSGRREVTASGRRAIVWQAVETKAAYKPA